MKASEALMAMRDGAQVALWWPDCEMFKVITFQPEEIVGLFLPDYSDEPGDIMSPEKFLLEYAGCAKEFELYETNKKPQ